MFMLQKYNDFQADLRQGDVLDLLRKASNERYHLVISSPPYNIGKSYERHDPRTLDEYVQWQEMVVEGVAKIVANNGSVCWQIGNYIKDGEVTPLDGVFIPLFKRLGFKLRNRIIWRFNFGLNADRRFSGRYETLLWFTKSESYTFNLDPVRIPQLYPGKRHSSKKGEAKAGRPSGNPLGKNPSDFWEFSAQKDFIENPVWDIPNVKANHIEKTDHPCQFPVELAERCILALSHQGDAILDPFVGTGASVIAALKHCRHAVGFDRDEGFLSTAHLRLAKLRAGNLPMRPLGQPVQSANSKSRVAKVPDEWIERGLSSESDGKEGIQKEVQIDTCAEGRCSKEASAHQSCS